MNVQRRKDIESLKDRLNLMIEEIESLVGQAEDIRCCEEEAYDSLPEGIQESERGENMQAAIDNLDSAQDDMEDLVDSINDVIDYLTEAQN